MNHRCRVSLFCFALTLAASGTAWAVPPGGPPGGGPPGEDGPHLADPIVVAAPDPFVLLEDGVLILSVGVDVRRAVLRAGGPNTHCLEVVATFQGSASAGPDRILETVVDVEAPPSGGGFEPLVVELEWDGLDERGQPAFDGTYRVDVAIHLVRETPGTDVLFGVAATSTVFDLSSIRPTAEVLSLMADAQGIADAAGGKELMSFEERSLYTSLLTLAMAGGIDAYEAAVDAQIAETAAKLAAAGSPLTGEQISAWRGLVLSEAGHFDIRWSETTGTPHRIWFGTDFFLIEEGEGELPPAYNFDKAVFAAEELFTKLHGLYEWGPLDELVFLDGFADFDLETVLVILQRYTNGIPVSSDSLVVVFGTGYDARGAFFLPLFLGSTVSRGITEAALLLDEVIKEDAAAGIALTAFESFDPVLGGPEDVVLPASDGVPTILALNLRPGGVDDFVAEPTLVFEVVVDPPESEASLFVPEMVAIDALTGDALLHRPLALHQGQVLMTSSTPYVDPLGSDRFFENPNVPVGGLAVLDASENFLEFTDNLGNYNLDGDFVLLDDGDVAIYTSFVLIPSRTMFAITGGIETINPAQGAIPFGTPPAFESTALTAFAWVRALRRFHPGNPLWDVGAPQPEIILTSSLLGAACGQYLPRPIGEIRVDISPPGCNRVGVVLDTILHEESHYLMRSYAAGIIPIPTQPDIRFFEGYAVFGPYSLAERELEGNMDERFVNLTAPAGLTRSWYGYHYHVLRDDRVLLSAPERNIVGRNAVAGVLLQAEMEGGIQPLEPVIRFAAELTGLSSHGIYNNMYDHLYNNVKAVAIATSGDRYVRGIDRAFDYHGVSGADPEFTLTNPDGTVFDTEGSVAYDPRPLFIEPALAPWVPGDTRVTTYKSPGSFDTEGFVFHAKRGVQYVITVAPGPGTTVFGDPFLVLDSPRYSPFSLWFFWCHDDCLDRDCAPFPGVPRPPSVVENEMGDCPVANSLYPRIEWIADYTGPAYLWVGNPPGTTGGGTYRLRISESDPSGNEYIAAAALARSVPGTLVPGTTIYGVLDDDTPVQYVKVHTAGRGPGFAGNNGGVCEDDFSFTVTSLGTTRVEPLFTRANAAGALLPLAPPIDVLGVQVIPVPVFGPIIAGGPGVVLLELTRPAPEGESVWSVSAELDPGTCDMPPLQVHDLSDFLNPMLIPRAPDGSIDPVVATIADTLYGRGPFTANRLSGGDDDYFQINLVEGEHVTVKVSPDLLVDVQGGPLDILNPNQSLAEPPFYMIIGAPGGVGPGGTVETAIWPAGAIRPGVLPPPPVPLLMAVAERGYLWSDKGELSLVAFRTGPYLFRVRDNTGTYAPIAYTFSVAVHAKEAAHGKLP